MECNFKIERDPHVKGYTMISNASNGKVLSLAAKGLLKELLSLPPDWHLSIGGLATILKDGKDAISSALKELEDNGYITRQKQFSIDKCGRRVFAGCFYTIYENPYTEKSYTENPCTENPHTENPCTENGGDIIINNKEINKDNKDLDKNNKESNDSSIATAKRKASIDYEEFKEFYNRTMDEAGAIIPRIDRITPKRKGMINARVKEYGMESVREVVRKSATSTYMNGAGRNGWVATFDWIFSPNNFVKIFENNYNDNNPNNNGRDNIRRGAWPTPAENATRAEEWATKRILELTQQEDKGIQGEIPDGRETDKLFLPF